MATPSLCDFAPAGYYRSINPMIDDAQLLREFAETQSEAAFAELVRRHLNLVHSAALRQLGGNPHLAGDACQQVFTALARQASKLARHPVLTGWLYTATHFSAAKIRRTEQRHQTHQQEAHAMQDLLSTPEPAADWDRLRPLLDTVMHELNERDRAALLLRFFEGRSFGELGAKIGVSENTARMRVDRALDKLRGILSRRGVTSTSAALSVLLAGQTVAAAPAGLAASVTGLAVAAGAVSGGAAGIISFMTSAKLSAGIAATVLIVATAGVVAQRRDTIRLQAEIEIARRETPSRPAQTDITQRLAPSAAEAQALREETAALPRLREEVAALKKQSPSPVTAKAARPKRPNAPGVYDMAKLDVKPAARSQLAPVYPLGLRVDGAPGEALIDFIVDRQGAVRDARVVKATEPEFGDNALAAVRAWKFTPGKKDGQPVETHMQVPIAFQISTDDDDGKPPVAPKH